MPAFALDFPQFGLTAISISVLWFFFAVLMLDSFDISLPRGDSIGVSGAVTAAAIILVGPVWASAICIASVIVTNLARHGADMRRRSLAAVLARSAALFAATMTAFVLSLRPDLYDSLLGAALVPLAYLLTDLVAAQLVAAVGTGRPIGRLLRGNLSVQAPLILAQLSASVLLMITYQGMGRGISMGDWSLIPAVALLFLIQAVLRDVAGYSRAVPYYC